MLPNTMFLFPLKRKLFSINNCNERRIYLKKLMDYLPFIKSAKLEQIVSGITYFPFPIFSNSLYILSPSKGYNPVVILYLEDIKTADIYIRLFFIPHTNYIDQFIR